MYEAFRRIARVPGRFQILLVENDSAYMKGLAERVRGDAFEGVERAADAWSTPKTGVQHEDIYLRGRDRQTLLAVVEKLTAAVPLPSGRAILLEKWIQDDIPRWRTYFVETAGGIGNADVAEASPARGFNDDPQVQVVLTAQGRKTFGDMTTRGVGRKIAIVIDGEVCRRRRGDPHPGRARPCHDQRQFVARPGLLKEEAEGPRAGPQFGTAACSAHVDGRGAGAADSDAGAGLGRPWPRSCFAPPSARTTSVMPPAALPPTVTSNLPGSTTNSFAVFQKPSASCPEREGDRLRLARFSVTRSKPFSSLTGRVTELTTSRK
jgi:hypothetical protein